MTAKRSKDGYWVCVDLTTLALRDHPYVSLLFEIWACESRAGQCDIIQGPASIAVHGVCAYVCAFYLGRHTQGRMDEITPVLKLSA